MNEAAHDLELAAHPAGIGPNRHEDLGTDADDVRELSHLAAVRFGHEPMTWGVGVDAIEDRVKAHVLFAGEIPVEAGTLEDDADPPAHGARLSNDVETVDGRRPVGRGQCRGQDRDRRRLASPVRPEQREEFAGAHIERYAVHRVALRLLVALDEPVDLDHLSGTLVGISQMWPVGSRSAGVRTPHYRSIGRFSSSTLHDSSCSSSSVLARPDRVSVHIPGDQPHRRWG